jgi:WD40 repeat protein
VRQRLAQGRELGGRIHEVEGHADTTKAVAFSPDGRLLATGSQAATVKLWDLGTGRLHRILSGLTGEVESVAFSPDGARLPHRRESSSGP